MKCIDCKYFKIQYEPFAYEWGKAKCERYNLYAEFKTRHQLKRLTHEEGRNVAESPVEMVRMSGRSVVG